MEQYDAIDSFTSYDRGATQQRIEMSKLAHGDMDLVFTQIFAENGVERGYCLFYRYKPGVPHPFRRARTQWEEGLC